MKTRLLLLLSVSFLLSFSCKKTGDNPSEENFPGQKIFLDTKAKAVVEADNTFGIKLFKNLVANTDDDQKSIIVSPLSISVALGMTYNGADDETKTAMENTLELQGMSVEEINGSYKTLIDELTSVDPDVAMEIPNSIWYENSFAVQDEFINTNHDYFYAEVNPLDFSNPASVDIINNWVADKTNDKITSILEEIDPMAIMFLINAVYFKGTWKYEFEEQNTTTGIFYLSNGTTTEVDMMKQRETFNYYSNELFEAVDLQYGGGNFSMVVLLPKDGFGPDDIVNELNEDNWSTWMENFSEMDIQLSMPKFKLEYEKELNQALIDLGMGVAFDPVNADFSKINPNAQLYIDFVKHKTFIDVNEEGTEAAAVTIVGIIYTSVGDEETPYYFNVNKPFVFAIKERDTRSIIFMGKVMVPEYEN
jgi:serpin B